MHLRGAQPRMLVYSRVEAQQTLHVLVSLNAETGGCTLGVPNPGCLFIGHGAKTSRLLGSPETRSLIFLINIHLIRRKVTWITYNPGKAHRHVFESKTKYVLIWYA
jgi:hypothetical protein